MIMLWAVALISAAVMALALYLRVSLDEDTARSKGFRAAQIAESGIAIALNPQVKKNDPLLRRDFGPGQSVEVKLRGEGGRINPNAVAADEDPELLLDLFIRWGLELEEASVVTDCILDWVDGNNVKRLQGAEEADYTKDGQPQYPRDKEFDSVEEMAAVRGMDLVDKLKPDWRDYFTVWSQGKVDVNEASAEILEVVTRASPDAVANLVEMRPGPDGEEGTEDDVKFANLEAVRRTLGMPEQEFKRVSPRLATSDPTTRIESAARVGDYTRRMSVVARRSDAQSTILSWIEP